MTLYDVGDVIESSNLNRYKIIEFLGGGGQGEVYKVENLFTKEKMAFKAYFPKYLDFDRFVIQRIHTLIDKNLPTHIFLSPLDMIYIDYVPVGYIMSLRDKRFVSFNKLLSGKVKTNYTNLIISCLHLAAGFGYINSIGYCYRDISLGNVFFDPTTGDVLICDCDNIDVNKTDRELFLCTMGFSAPEIETLHVPPNTLTDLWSLAVLFFHILFRGHPLEGSKEANIHVFDLAAQKQIYIENPVFMFDPINDTNRPVPGYHDTVINHWNKYPEELKELFVKAFTEGIKDPDKRIRISEWRDCYINMLNSLYICKHCGCANWITDFSLVDQKCHKCENQIESLLVLKIQGYDEIILNCDTKLIEFHIRKIKSNNCLKVVGQVVQHPTQPNVWGMKNISESTWKIINKDLNPIEVPPQKSFGLTLGTKVMFGEREGEIVQIEGKKVELEVMES